MRYRDVVIKGRIIVTNKGVSRLQAGEVWLGRGYVEGRRPTHPGIYALLDKKRRFVGLAFLSPSSPHYLRIFSREEVEPDERYWKKVIREAYEKRKGLASITNAMRIVHGEADKIPSVVIDMYGDIVSFQITSYGAETIKEIIISIILELFRPSAIIEKDNATQRKIEGLPLIERIVCGEKHVASVYEGGLTFELDVLGGQKTGAYLDYRELRSAASNLAGGRVLDGFSYEGWLSCLLSRKVAYVISIDSSADAIKAGIKNASINGCENIEFVRCDVVKYLASSNEVFNFIHLDPPPLAKRRMDLMPALAYYRRLAQLALRALDRDGILMISSCSQAVSMEALERVIIEATQKRNGTVIFRGMQDTRDHPIIPGRKELFYLKAVAVKVD